MAFSDDDEAEDVLDYLTYPQNRTTDAQTQTWEKLTKDKVMTYKPKQTLGTPSDNCHIPCKASDALHKLTTYMTADIAKRQVATTYKIVSTINHTQNTTETLLYLNYHPQIQQEHHEVIDLTREVTEIALHPMRQGRILEFWRTLYKKAMWNLQQKAAGKQPINYTEWQRTEENINKLIRRLTKGEIIPHNWEFSYSAQHKPRDKTTEYKFRFNQQHDIRCTEIQKTFYPHTREDEIYDWEKEIKAITNNSRLNSPLTNRMEAINKFSAWLNTLNRPEFGEKYYMAIQPSTKRRRAKIFVNHDGGPVLQRSRAYDYCAIKITNKEITDQTIQEWKQRVIERLHISYHRLDNSIKIPSSLPHLDDNDNSDTNENNHIADQMELPGGFQPLQLPPGQGFQNQQESGDEGYPD